MTKKENKENNKKIKILLLIFIFVCVLFNIILYSISTIRHEEEKMKRMERTVKYWKDISYGNKYFEGEDLRGLKSNAIYDILKEKLEKNIDRKIKFKINKKQEIYKVVDLTNGFVFNCDGLENDGSTDVVSKKIMMII